MWLFPKIILQELEREVLDYSLLFLLEILDIASNFLTFKLPKSDYQFSLLAASHFLLK